MSSELPVYVLYADPLDYPGQYVVREHRVGPGGQVRPCRDVITVRSMDSTNSAALIEEFTEHGLHWLGRHDQDDVKIVGCWI